MEVKKIRDCIIGATAIPNLLGTGAGKPAGLLSGRLLFFPGFAAGEENAKGRKKLKILPLSYQAGQHQFFQKQHRSCPLFNSVIFK